MKISHILKTKGHVFFRRSFMILGRYGLGSRKIERNLRMLAGLLRRYGVRATIPVPAVVYERHEDFLERFADVFEYAVHGYFHRDYSKVSNGECLEGLKVAKDVVGAAGFRAPNHKSSDGVVGSLNKAGYDYDSSDVIVGLPMLRENNETKNIIAFYSKAASSRPHYKGKVLEIPVSLPDDELMIDRLRWGEGKILKQWLSALNRCVSEGEVFVLQLHPERVHLVRDVLERLIVHAVNNGVPIKTLGEVASAAFSAAPYRISRSRASRNFLASSETTQNPGENQNWWKKMWPKGCFCITGDLDFFSVYEKVFVI